jgi:phenylalanyl-tRNA synthetase beta subunit
MVKKEIGVIGEIHPEVLLSWELEQPVACFELNLSHLYPI